MQVPLEITFRGMSPSSSAEAAIQSWVVRLEHLYSRIHRCSVVIAVPHQHHRQGNPFQVRIELTVPGQEIVVSHDPEREPGRSEDLYLALDDAFLAARRQLQDYARIQRGEVKAHHV